MRSFGRRCFFAFVATCGASASAGTPVPVDEPPAVSSTSFANYDTLTGYFFGKTNVLDSAYDEWQQWKKDHHIPISIGAEHWFHVDGKKEIYGNGYGVPGERGTYHYDLIFYPSLKLQDNAYVNEVGLQFHERFRDTDDKLRSFYKSTIWTYEAYAYANSRFGIFKGGLIIQQFGIAWDNSWWEGIPYFDGYRFNPAWGFSWDNSWKVNDKLRVDTAAQYFIASDRVSGAIANADAESSLAGERNTFMLRIVPTLQIKSDTKIALGLSALTREVAYPNKFAPVFLDDRQTAWCTDVSISWKTLTLYSQYTASYGAIAPARYVSGGPSNRLRNVEGGINYKLGPISAHLNYSAGWDYNPGGHQYIFNPGITFQISKSLVFYTEYVKWNVTNNAGVRSRFDDGFELTLVWNF